MGSGRRQRGGVQAGAAGQQGRGKLRRCTQAELRCVADRGLERQGRGAVHRLLQPRVQGQPEADGRVQVSAVQATARSGHRSEQRRAEGPRGQGWLRQAMARAQGARGQPGLQGHRTRVAAVAARCVHRAGEWQRQDHPARQLHLLRGLRRQDRSAVQGPGCIVRGGGPDSQGQALAQRHRRAVSEGSRQGAGAHLEERELCLLHHL